MPPLKNHSIYMLFCLLIIVIVGNNSMVVNADSTLPLTSTFFDSTTESELGDVEKISFLIYEDQLSISINYSQKMPESMDYTRFGNIWLNVDENRTTGYQRDFLGSDYRIDFRVFNEEFTIGEIFQYNKTLRTFIFIENINIKSNKDSNIITIQMPLNKINVKNSTVIDFSGLFKTQVYDRIYNNINYLIKNNSAINVDGLKSDWDEIAIFSETDIEYEPEHDFLNFYITNNDTYLFQRFDVFGDIETVVNNDIFHSGWFRVYYDGDNSRQTGYRIYNIGADYLLLINTERDSTQGSPYGYMHKWIEPNSSWDWDNKIRINDVSIKDTYEFGIPISMINVNMNDITILLAELISEEIDSVPNNGFLTYKPPYMQIYKSEVSDFRVDVNTNQTVSFKVKWSNNNTVTSGYLQINDKIHPINENGLIKFEVYSDKIEKQEWYVQEAYSLGLTSFELITDTPSIIWDKVLIDVPEDTRINYGLDFPNKYFRYGFDDDIFNGTIFFNQTINDIPIGEYALKVIKIEDNKYNISEFESKDISVIIDRVNLNIEILDNRIDVSEWPNIKIRGYYEYDSSPFIGTILINDPITVSEVDKHSYKILSIKDDYGIMEFKSNIVDCIWDKIIIYDGGVSSNQSRIGNNEKIWIKTKYAYDDKEFSGSDGSVFINWLKCEWSDEEKLWYINVSSNEVGNAEYFVTQIIDNKYDLNGFSQKINKLTINWTEENDSLNLVSFKNIFILMGLFSILIIKLPRLFIKINFKI